MRLDGKLLDLLAGTTEVVPYGHGEKVWLYCGKACRKVEHTVTKYGDNEARALCGYGGCTSTVPELPTRHRVTEQQFERAAAAFVRALVSRATAADHG
jgi:hypothetical protein